MATEPRGEGWQPRSRQENGGGVRWSRTAWRMVEPSAPPRILFEDVPESLRADLAPCAATAGFVGATEAVRDTDWDLLVTFAQNPSRSIPYVLSFGATEFRFVDTTFTRSGETPVRDIALGHAATLARRTILPSLSARERSFWEWSAPEVPGSAVCPITGCPVTTSPIVTLGERRLLHSFVALDGGARAWWALPGETQDRPAWLRLVLAWLREVAPDRFLGSPTWRQGREWASSDLQRLFETRTAEQERHRAEVLRHRLEMSRLAGEMSAAREEAAAGVWRLLVGQGAELVDAVGEALTLIGFEVDRRDAETSAPSGPRLEDLRVRLPGDPGWECLVGVTAYSTGASVSDVGRVAGRPATRYAVEKNRAPSALWHLVNTFTDENPGARPAAFPDPAAELAVLAENDGTVIDTRDLFRALREVVAGRVDAADVRRSLVVSRLLWTWPAVDEG